MTDWYDRLPKVELHLHLEGAIPLPALHTLILKYKGEAQAPDLASLERKFNYRDFRHFLELWRWKNTFLRELEDFTYIGAEIARDLARQNIRYVEAFYSPADFRSQNLSPQDLTAALYAGLQRVPEVQVRLVCDLVRDDGPEQGARTLAAVAEVRKYGVIGIGIGGAEHLFPPEPFAPVYAEARRLGFHATAHAGEAAGPASIWGALDALHVERIGHATRAQEDHHLLEALAERRVPLELCPLSNVRTGIVPSLQAHPVRRYLDRGLAVTINTDDPQMFCNSLALEYRLLAREHGFTRDEIRGLILAAIDASWMTREAKQALAGQFCNDPDWQSG